MEAGNRETELNRAYVQSRVIESGLHHLTTTLSLVDPELRDDLSGYTRDFDAYVRRLSDARVRAEAEARKS
jgi:hypothetical protein